MGEGLLILFFAIFGLLAAAKYLIFKFEEFSSINLLAMGTISAFVDESLINILVRNSMGKNFYQYVSYTLVLMLIYFFIILFFITIKNLVYKV